MAGFFMRGKMAGTGGLAMVDVGLAELLIYVLLAFIVIALIRGVIRYKNRRRLRSRK